MLPLGAIRGSAQRTLCILLVFSACCAKSGAGSRTGLTGSEVEEAIGSEPLISTGSDAVAIADSLEGPDGSSLPLPQPPSKSRKRRSAPKPEPLAMALWTFFRRGSAGVAEGSVGALLSSVAAQVKAEPSWDDEDDDSIEGLINVELTEAAQVWAQELFWMWLLLAIGMGIVRHCNPEPVPPVDPAKTHMKEFMSRWQSGLFDCFSDTETCLCACCCFPVAWAETYSKIGLIKFLQGFLILLGLQVLARGQMNFLSMVCVFGSVLMRTLFRQNFRQKFGMPHGTLGVVFGDCMALLFCGCCAVAQESRQVNMAALVGHAAVVRPAASEVCLTTFSAEEALPTQASAPSAPPHEPPDANTVEATVVQDAAKPADGDAK
mmetsp:Transcript_28625/g.66332  ORF Transcript_28625/g.66332 Transcript_28625/m.66332 type:complete len:377 (-) Transcript_28625:76-1206(-)